MSRYEVTEFARANNGSPVFLLPPGTELDKITRYEAHLSRQFYQAKHELEVLQKQRRGEATPLAPPGRARSVRAVDRAQQPERQHHDAAGERPCGAAPRVAPRWRRSPGAHNAGWTAETTKQIKNYDSKSE